MAQSYTALFYHIVFSTKDRVPVLSPEIQQRLYPYIGGIIRNDIGTSIAIGGMPDHVHVLCTAKSDIAPSKIAQLIKGNSSKWMNETFSFPGRFEWQSGYGGFTVSLSLVEKVKGYILNQLEHHRKLTFMEEWELFMREHERFFKSLK